MKRYVYKIDNRKFVFYQVGKDWFYGRGCHMRALSTYIHNQPLRILKTRPV